MDQKQRLAKILELLEEKKKLSQIEIAEVFSISKDTARRDILLLAESNLVERYRGGITLPYTKAKIEKYTERLITHAPEKESLAKLAITRFMKNNMTIMLDVSTTVNFIAQHIRQEHILLVTHSIDNALACSQTNEKNRIFLLGGFFNPASHMLAGPSIVEQLDQFEFDVAFIGALGINSTGIFYSELDDLYMKKRMIQNARKVCLLVDSSKVNQTSSFKLDFTGIDCIITTIPFPNEIEKVLSTHNIEVIYEKEGGMK